MTRGPLAGLLFTVWGGSADMIQPPLFARVW
jgi:hypothetical protein